MQIDPLNNTNDDRLGRVQSRVRAFGILDVLADAQGLTLSEVSRLVALPRSTTHRLLSTMEALDIVMFDRARGSWSIGIKAFTVGAAFEHSRDLGKLGRPIMRDLMLQVDRSVNIAVPERTGMCYVGQVEASAARRNAARPGACLPMDTTAAGKALMACWSPDELGEYLGRHALRTRTRTRQSITDHEALRDELQEDRERGYAIDDEEHADGLRCVAAAVLDRFGVPQASLSISDTAVSLDRGRMAAIAPSLRTAAARMSAQISSHL